MQEDPTMASVGITVPSSSPSPSQPTSVAPASGRLWTAAYVRLLAVQMAFGLSYSAFLLLPKYLSTELRSSATEIGWVMGAALVVAAIAGPLLGAGAARFSKRKLLLFGLAGSGSAALLFPFADRVGPLLYGLRLVQGLSFVAIFNSTAVLVADRVDGRRLGQAIGYLGLAMLMTNALAPAVTEPLAESQGWGLAFASAGVLALAACLLVIGVEEAPEDETPAPDGAALQRGSQRLPIYYASGLVGVGLGVMFTFTQPYALELGAQRVGDFFFGYVASAVFMRTALGRLADRLGTGRVAVGALALYGAVVLATALLTPSLLPVLGVGLGAAHGLIYPALTAFARGRANARERGAIMGWFAGSYNAGFALSVLGLGPVADWAGFPVIFVIAGLLVLTGVLPLSRAARAAYRALPESGATPRP
jgi:MFS family permease